VPTIYHMIRAASKDLDVDLRSLRFGLCAGSPLSLELREQFENKFRFRIIHCYGMTEISLIAACEDPPALQRAYLWDTCCRTYGSTSSGLTDHALKKEKSGKSILVRKERSVVTGMHLLRQKRPSGTAGLPQAIWAVLMNKITSISWIEKKI